MDVKTVKAQTPEILTLSKSALFVTTKAILDFTNP